MASKKQLVQSDYISVQGLQAPSAGFIAFGAKIDGLYLKNGIAPEEKILTITAFKTAYDIDIIGLKDNNNTTFTIVDNYIPGSTKVYLNGLRLQNGEDYDYIETNSNQIAFNYPIISTDLIIIDYIKL